ncbi:helix-turn-helix transcriptional regulator [Mesorhizobium comanense]|uniref:helix-turn-helix transcriptional regulator n=1 Tax=Mesorhizobium comanense TaxID=2502215 RepID=UPI0010FA5595|nr:helix-turn-helix transcriptional regulator [Mesorhizobium comanense]
MAALRLQSSVFDHQWYSRIGSALSAAGTEGFVSELKAALSLVLSLECVQFALEREGEQPVLLYEEGIPENTHAGLIGRYFDFGYFLDPLCLAVQGGIAQGFYSMTEVAPDNFTKSEYYKRFYAANGVSEDCYFVVDLDPATKLTLCFFQGRSGSRFTTKELDFLRAVEPLVRQMLLLHARTKRIGERHGPVSDERAQQRHLVADHIKQAFDTFGSQTLSPRERHVAKLILRGHSAKSASDILRVSVETVRMHRRHLYAKLNINAQSELFASFLDWLSTSEVSPNTPDNEASK